MGSADTRDFDDDARIMRKVKHRITLRSREPRSCHHGEHATISDETPTNVDETDRLIPLQLALNDPELAGGANMSAEILI